MAAMRNTLIILLLAAVASAAEGEGSLGQAVAELEVALKGEDVNQTTTLLSSMPGLFKAAEEADQKSALQIIGKAVKTDDLRVRHGAMAALGAIGAKGTSKYLKKWLKPPKKFKGEIPPTYAEAMRAAGKIADASTLAQLRKLSNHFELTLAVEGTHALGGYHKLPTKRRKGLALDLVKRLELLSSPPGRRGGWRESERMRKAGLGAATIQALKQLTGKSFGTPKGWTNWKEKAEKQRDPFQ